MNHSASWPIKALSSFKRMYQGYLHSLSYYFFSPTPLNLLCLATLLGLLYFSHYRLQEIYSYY